MLDGVCIRQEERQPDRHLELERRVIFPIGHFSWLLVGRLGLRFGLVGLSFLSGCLFFGGFLGLDLGCFVIKLLF